ncbi:hypothetical protein [Nocardia brasiliensis]|nr:hypothetical protein [Nocardia brasiliensis]
MNLARRVCPGKTPVLLLGVLQRLRSFGSGRAAAHPETADPRCCFSVMYA